MDHSLSDYTIGQNETVLAAASVIQANHARCSIVVNEQKTVVGVFSEGDILRSLLDGVDTFTPLSKILKSNFLYLKNRDLPKALELIKSRQITLIPVLDDNYQLTDVITLSDILERIGTEEL